MTTIYVTKYALSGGIQKLDCRIEQRGSMAVEDAQIPRFFHGEGKEWHRTEAEAVARAEEMRTAKIASLMKQVDKLRKLDFRAREARDG